MTSFKACGSKYTKPALKSSPYYGNADDALAVERTPSPLAWITAFSALHDFVSLKTISQMEHTAGALKLFRAGKLLLGFDVPGSRDVDEPGFPFSKLFAFVIGFITRSLCLSRPLLLVRWGHGAQRC